MIPINRLWTNANDRYYALRTPIQKILLREVSRSSVARSAGVRRRFSSTVRSSWRDRLVLLSFPVSAMWPTFTRSRETGRTGCSRASRLPWDCNRVAIGLPNEVLERAAELERTVYRSPDWTGRR